MKLSDQITRRHLFVAFGTSQQTGGLSSVDLAATRDGASVTLTASDGSVAPISGADAASAGVMTAGDKTRLDALPPTTTREFAAAAEVPAAAVAPAITHLRTAGYATRGDGGGGLYARVATQPAHAGKLQSQDGSWWELVPEGGRWRAEQFGAVNRGTADDHAALTAALAATKLKAVTLAAKGLYLLSDTLVFPAGRYSFEGPGHLTIGAGVFNAGFKWNGPDNKAIVEIHQVSISTIESLVVSGLDSAATGVTGILIHAPDAGSAVQSINHNRIGFIGIEGCNVGLQVGDFTNDGYDSNFDDNVIGMLLTRDVATPLILDSDSQDNLLIQRFHNGGPMTSEGGPSKGTRTHVIHVKRWGNGLHIQDGFARLDGIVADSAGIKVEDGSFSCEYFSFEGETVTARLIDIANLAASRDHNVLQKVTAPSPLRDSAGKVMDLQGKGGTVLIGCNVPGNIELGARGVTAIDTMFEGSYGFLSTNREQIVEINTRTRTTTEASPAGNSGRVNAGAFVPFERTPVAGGTVYANLDKGSIIPHNLTANANVTAPTNADPVRDIGREIEFRFTGDATTAYAVTFNSIYKLAGGSYTHSGARKTDIIAFRYDGTSWWETRRSVSMA